MKESIIFLVNIGVTCHGTQSNSQLLDKAKIILKHSIQQKIFLSPKDEVGVILMGSDSIRDDSITGLENVQELCDMQVANWDLIERIDKLQNTNQSSTWMEAIYAAIDYIKHECIDKSKRKLILLSDFNEEEDIVCQFKSKDIAKSLSSEEIFLITIGERALLDSVDEDSYTASEALLVEVLQKIASEYLTFERAKSDMRFYSRPSITPAQWKCGMELGDFQISIIGISQMLKKPDFPKMISIAKTDSSSDEQVSIKTAAQYIDHNRTIYSEDSIIHGYIYGSKPISIPDSVEKTMAKTTEKCYRIHGFTATENVPMTHWLSDGTYVILPRDESTSAPFYSLIKTMIKKNVVAIVEKIYRKNSESGMVALFPSVDVPNEPWCLVEIGLPFERDYGAIAHRPLEFLTKQLSTEQSDAMDDLLTSLEISDSDDNITSDRYLPGCMPDPSAQHLWNAISVRALNPDKSLPPVADYVKNLLAQPESVREKCEPAVEKIKNLFSLEKREPKTRKYRTSRKEDNAESDGQDDVSTVQSAKEKEKETEKDNTDVENQSFTVDADDYEFDDINDI